jgi:hypothetical protein
LFIQASPGFLPQKKGIRRYGQKPVPETPRPRFPNTHKKSIRDLEDKRMKLLSRYVPRLQFLKILKDSWQRIVCTCQGVMRKYPKNPRRLFPTAKVSPEIVPLTTAKNLLRLSRKTGEKWP